MIPNLLRAKEHPDINFKDKGKNVSKQEVLHFN